jgi:hypothetical protein
MSTVPKQNSLVQANSVQSQFTALTNDRDKFQREKETAERDHRQTQERLQHFKREHIDLLTKIRTAQEESGNLSRKQSMLNHEQARLGRVMECERNGLEDCAVHTKNLAKKEEDLTKLYCTELGTLNDETADLLQRQINKRTIKLLSVESVEAVFIDKLPWEAHNEKEAFYEGFDLMKEAKAKWEALLTRYHNLKATLEKVESVPGQNSTIGNVDGGRLSVGDGMILSQNHMDLFYGTADIYAVAAGGD